MSRARRVAFAVWVALAVLIAGAVLLAVTMAGMLTVRSWKDVSFGTSTAYCGVAVRSASVEFYCQHGT